MSASLSKVTGQVDLDQLADAIRRHHKAAERHAQKMVAEAVAAGELLLEAKDRLGHGGFGPFLILCGVNPRTARLYMQLARNSGNVAVLEAKSFRAALAAIAGPSPTPPKGFVYRPHPASLARDPVWQKRQWLRAMLDKGRDDLPLDEVSQLVRDHVDHHGRPKDPLSYEKAQSRWKLPYWCGVCEGWHGGWIFRGEITEEMVRGLVLERG